jgi:hypothetical protein
MSTLAPKAPQQRIATWLFSAVLVVAAWPVFSNLLLFLPNLPYVIQGEWNTEPVHLLNKAFWIGTAILEPVMVLLGALFAWISRNKIVRALPSSLYILGFLVSYVLLFVLQIQGQLYGGISAWDLLVGTLPQSGFYVASFAVALVAVILELAEKAPFPARAAGGISGPANRQPVAFDTNTGQPIYGYDTQTGAPIY